MDWIVAVATSVGLGVLAGWIYAGFPGLGKRLQRVNEPSASASSPLVRVTSKV
jgi:hypothetical protein